MRDFKTPHDHKLWFVYPLHTSLHADLLADCLPEGEPPIPPSRRRKIVSTVPKKDQCKEQYALDPSAFQTVTDIRRTFDVSDDTVRRWAKYCGYTVENNLIKPRK